MFTGIIQTIGKCSGMSARDEGLDFWVDLGPVFDGCQIGDSIAVNGCCLTVERFEGSRAHFHAGRETLSLTNLGRLAESSRVNVEPALKIGDPIGGHLVSGHVDGVGSVSAISAEESQTLMRFRLPRGGAERVIKKGSIALDGVSLTVTEVCDDQVAVALIPHTLAATRFGEVSVGDPVNVEFDQMGSWVRQLVDQVLEERIESMLEQKLKERER